MKKVTIPLLMILFVFIACQNQSYVEYEKQIKEEQIFLPLDSMFLLYPQREIPSYMIPRNVPQFRYVVYFDSLTCATCRLYKLGVWRSIMKHTEDMGAKVDFIFIFAPKLNNKDDFREAYIQQKISLPIYLDTTYIFERHNPLLRKSSIFHAFILNDSNHIEVIGNAGNSELVERKYYEFLHKKVTERNAY